MMLSKFDEMKNEHVYKFPGGHRWSAWRNDLYEIAPLLFK